MSKKICVLASGGDAPGMNACVESVFHNATARGYTIYGAIAGYNGLVKDDIVFLTRDCHPEKKYAVATNIGHLSGCVLNCGRSEEFTTQAGFNKALAVIKKHRFDALVILGGNGSLNGAERLTKAGIPTIAIPATIDNDVAFTGNSLGFSSAMEECVRLIDNLSATMQTNDRDHIVQLMGRYCSDLAVMVGAATFATIVDTIDARHSPAEVAEIFKLSRSRGRTSNLMVMQEKKNIDVATEAMETASYLQELAQLTGETHVRMTTLGHLQRGAAPSGRDRWLASFYGERAVNSISANQFGVAIGMVRDYFISVPIEKVGVSPK